MAAQAPENHRVDARTATPGSDSTGPAPADSPRAKAGLFLRSLLTDGFTPFAAAASVVCIAAVSAVAWIGDRAAVEQLNADRHATAASTLRQLACALTPLLRDDDLSAARRLMVEYSASPAIAGASLTLPDGRVVADSQPSAIVIRELPKSWRGPADAASLATGQNPDPAAPFLLESIDVAPRGSLFLKLRLAAPATTAFALGELTAMALVSAVSLAGILLVCRRVRSRVTCLSAVAEALGTLATNAEPPEQLKLDDRMGTPAAHWNRVLDQLITLRREDRSATLRAALMDGLGSSTAHKSTQDGDGVADRRSGGELHSAIDLLPMGVIIVDERGSIRTANGAAASLLGQDRAAMLGADVRSVLAGEAFADAVALTQRAGASAVGGGERRTLEIDRTNTGGGILRINVRPLRRDDPGGALVTIEDVTQQRIADASRNQFVAQATHELRAPLTNMRLCLESALDDDAQNLDALTTHLNVLNDETRRLERLVSEMLSVAEIEAGSLSLRSDDVKLDRIFEELKHDYAKTCTEKQLTLNFELPPKYPQLRGDRDKLMAAMHNLLNNAVKYTPVGGRVTVAARQDGDRFAIDISDTGIGIPAEDQPRIFERFFRARDPRVAKITGTGLGLALSREVARLHGGALTFKSELNRGTTFTLQLPVALQPA